VQFVRGSRDWCGVTFARGIGIGFIRLSPFCSYLLPVGSISPFGFCILSQSTSLQVKYQKLELNVSKASEDMAQQCYATSEGSDIRTAGPSLSTPSSLARAALTSTSDGQL